MTSASEIAQRRSFTLALLHLCDNGKCFIRRCLMCAEGAGFCEAELVAVGLTQSPWSGLFLKS